MPIDTISLRNRLQPEVAKALGQGTKGVGDTMKYVCPFHKEKTPSFVVWESHYHCYGCGAHGDVFEFIQKFYNVNFKEAATQLGAESTDSAAIEQYKLQRQMEINAEDETRHNARLEFNRTGAWRKFHENMDARAKQWWTSKGIPPSLQEAWALGFTPDKPYSVDDKLYHSSAYVMPMWSFNNSVETVQYRLNDPIDKSNRFRYEKGLGSAPFVTKPQWQAGETSGDVHGVRACLVVEGPRKAATVRSFVSPHLQVVGIPSKSDLGGCLPQLKAFQFVWVILDPDVRIKPDNALPTWVPADIRLCKAIGADKSAYVSLSGKIDDMLLDGSLTAEKLNFRLREATMV